jgi:hypothetical protein
MTDSKQRVLAYNLAVEINTDTLKDIAGGTTFYTHGYTHYYTSKKGVEDKESDDYWD